MSDKNVTPIKGFRQAPQPTKGQVLKENETLGQQLTQRIQGLQQFFGNLINQLMRQSKTHDQELSQVSLWLAGKLVDDAAQKGDHLLMDYIGVLLNEDGTEAQVTVETVEGPKQIPDYFDGGAGKLFMLTNLGGGTLIAGFEEQLIGMKAGEGKVVEVQFPKEYGVASLQDKKAKFTVFIHEVNRSYSNSPVGDLIDENQRIRDAAKAKALADAQAVAAEARAKKEAEKAPEAPKAEMDSAPAEASQPEAAPEAQAPAAEAAPEQAPST